MSDEVTNIQHFTGSPDGLKKALVKAGGLVVLDLFADWCGPCKMVGQVLPQIAKKYPSVTFMKVNVDQNQEISEQFNVQSIPQFKFFKDQKEDKPLIAVASITGADIGGILNQIELLK